MLKSTIPIETWEKRKYIERGGGNRMQEIIIRRWERSNKRRKAKLGLPGYSSGWA